jgi:hypothetical protein
MSMFERDDYHWRETYFVMFESSRRPTLRQVEQKLSALSERFQLTEASALEEGEFETVTVLAPDECAAVDVSYLEGEDVGTEGARLGQELRGAVDRATIERLKACDARFDLMHFEQVDATGEDDPDETFDPSALLMVLEALVELTDGIGIDPQSGALM